MLMDMIGEARDNFKKLAVDNKKKHTAYSKNKDDDTKAQDALAKCKRYEFLFKCSSEAFEKAEKYYNHCDKAAAYYLAIVLGPRDKMNWFHQQWDKYPTTKATWIPGVRRQVLEVWDDEYYQAPSAAPPTRSGDSDEPSPCKISSSSKYARFFTNRHVVSGQAPQAVDHFRQYLDEDPIAAEKDFDVIDYWMKRREVIRSRLVAMVVVLFCLFKGFATTFEEELVPFTFGESVLGFRVKD